MSLNPPPPENLELIRERLGRIRAEALQLEAEITAREADQQLGFSSALYSVEPAMSAAAPPVTPEDKVALFLNLFATRRSVFPKLWENPKTGRKGYSPVCDNEWRTGVCQKPRVKCSECLHQKFPPLDERAVEAHLRGQHTLGVYAIGVEQHLPVSRRRFRWRGLARRRSRLPRRRHPLRDYRGCGALAFGQWRPCMDVLCRVRARSAGATPRTSIDCPRFGGAARPRSGGL